MTSHLRNIHIFVIDQQNYWRQLALTVLESQGFAVSAFSDYMSALMSIPRELKPDLIILGCAVVGTEEHQLISKLVKERHKLAVLCNALSWQETRELLVLGVKAVTDKPYDPTNIVHVVEQVLEGLAQRDSYQIVEQGV